MEQLRLIKHQPPVIEWRLGELLHVVGDVERAGVPGVQLAEGEDFELGRIELVEVDDGAIAGDGPHDAVFADLDEALGVCLESGGDGAGRFPGYVAVERVC